MLNSTQCHTHNMFENPLYPGCSLFQDSTLFFFCPGTVYPALRNYFVRPDRQCYSQPLGAESFFFFFFSVMEKKKMLSPPVIKVNKKKGVNSCNTCRYVRVTPLFAVIGCFVAFSIYLTYWQWQLMSKITRLSTYWWKNMYVLWQKWQCCTRKTILSLLLLSKS